MEHPDESVPFQGVPLGGQALILDLLLLFTVCLEPLFDDGLHSSWHSLVVLIGSMSLGVKILKW